MTGAYQPVFELTRGKIVESTHFGAVAVVDSSGHLLAWHGDPKLVTFMRSSAKPLQALPFIELGGDQAFHLTSKEVAILCASHEGTDEHVEVIKGIQAKVGVRGERPVMRYAPAQPPSHRRGHAGTRRSP